MNTGPRDLVRDRPATWRDHVLPVLSGASAAFLTFLMVRRGITVTPDGWAYWEGAVSLLAGDGYRHFGSGPITAFPPLFSVYLAGVQGVFGISGGTLMLSVALLSATTAVVWIVALRALRGAIPANRAQAVAVEAAVAVFLACYVAANFTALLAETLVLPLYGAAIALAARLTEDRRPRLLFISGLFLSCAGLLLTKNAALAMVAALGAAMVCMASAWRTRLIVLATLAASVAAWIVTRHALGQGGSHPIAVERLGLFVPLMIESLSDLVRLLGPPRFGIGYLLGAACLSLAAWVILCERGGVRRPAAFLVAQIATSVLFLILLFSVTWVADPPTGRFIWHVPLLVVLLLALVASRELTASPGLRSIAFGVLLALTLLQVYRTGGHVLARANVSDGATGVARLEAIDARSFNVRHQADDGRTIIPVPDFDWITRDRSQSR